MQKIICNQLISSESLKEFKQQNNLYALEIKIVEHTINKIVSNQFLLSSRKIVLFF